ncbi:MAG: glycosyltransferase family 39 protein [Planctomycetota bacterium]
MVALVYLAIACVVFAPGVLSPSDWVGTEARRLQIAVEMVQSGDWLVPTLGHEPTLSKPPLFYWVTALLHGWLPGHDWLLRTPGPAMMWVTACLAHFLVRRSHGKGAAWCAGLGALLAPIVVATVPRAEIDPLFAGLTSVSILLMAYGAAFGQRATSALGGLVGGMAILVKGPPFAMFLVGTAAVWLRRRRGRGLPVALLAMAVPPTAYYLALTQRLQVGTLVDVATNESVARMALFTWGHVLDTPMHFVRAFAATLPFGLLLFFEYRGARRAEPDDAEAFVRMLAAAFFSSVLVLAVFPARPMRYLLPAVPLFFVAVSPSVAAFARQPWLTPGIRASLRALALLGAAGLCASPWLPAPMGWQTALGFLALAVLPQIATDGRRAVATLLVLPVVAAWTFLAPFADYRTAAREPFRAAGAVLRRAVDEAGANDLATLLHVHSAVLLHAGLLPPGDELARRDPTAPWLLMEEGAGPTGEWSHVARAELPPPAYVPRVRLQLPRVALLLMERR